MHTALKVLIPVLLVFAVVSTVRTVSAQENTKSFMAGGIQTDEVSEKVVNLVASLKDECAKRMNVQFTQFTPVSVRKQVVAGVMYYVKVDAGDNGFYELKMYVSFTVHAGDAIQRSSWSKPWEKLTKLLDVKQL